MPVQNVTGILIVIILNLYITLDSMEILTILIFPIHECEIPLHLFAVPFGSADFTAGSILES